jgi:hypothetical protein
MVLPFSTVKSIPVDVDMCILPEGVASCLAFTMSADNAEYYHSAFESDNSRK